ncbi:MAG: sensor histidine kinase [Clostridiales bacterium]|nr:sensor histidine kinase [Clostridiales bacterium]
MLLLVFFLENQQIGTVMYGFLLAFTVFAAVEAYAFVRFCGTHRELDKLLESVRTSLDHLPETPYRLEQDYQALLEAVHESKLELLSATDRRYSDMMDYYTLWAHQIKTPIAAMSALLQEMEQSPRTAELRQELFKIEQYVDMVLGYLRLESTSNDLILARCDLAPIVKQALRKYAAVFAHRKVKLDLQELNTGILTDEKWLVFVLEQILSNALKYTHAGGEISIYLEPDQACTLVIRDTGMGIRAEDLPRIFEKGYTGYNGRMDKKATGLGLYLCRRTMDKLGHTMSIDSQVGVGTAVRLDLSRAEFSHE